MDFLGMEVQSRREFVKSNKLCFNCLRIGHSSARCQSKFRCRSCNTRHRSLVHDDSVKTNLNHSANAFFSNSVNRSQTNEFTPRGVSITSNLPSTSAQVEYLVNNHSINIARHIPQTLLPTAIGKFLISTVNTIKSAFL